MALLHFFVKGVFNTIGIDTNLLIENIKISP